MTLHIPSKSAGIRADLQAHTRGPAGGEWNGGWFTSMTIAGSTVDAKLKSKVIKDAETPCSAWWEHLAVIDETMLQFVVLVDAKSNDATNGAAILGALVGSSKSDITFSGSVRGKNTRTGAQKADLLKQVTLTGYVARRGGELQLFGGQVTDLGAVSFATFQLGIEFKTKTTLDVCFGGSVIDKWEVAPTQ